MEEWRRETEFGLEIRRRREGTVDMKKISDTQPRVMVLLKYKRAKVVQLIFLCILEHKRRKGLQPAQTRSFKDECSTRSNNDLREDIPKKCCCSFGFCPNEGQGEGPAQIFCHLFISVFLVNKRSLFPPKCQYFEL